MATRLLALLLSVFQMAVVSAQQGTIRGSVTDDKTKETLGGVSIYIDGKGATTSGPEGTYELKCATGTHSLEFKLMGYSPAIRKAEVKENEITKLDAALSIEATELGTMVISAGKFEQKLEEVTVSMDVMKQSLIENKNTVNMEDMMQQCPGVNILDGQANIRGGSGFSYGAGTRVLVLVDDLPLLTADAGDVKWNFIPAENIEQVEVIKGASSALFGSSALNGVINIRTTYPKDSARTSVTMSKGFYSTPQRDSLRWWDGANRPVITNASVMHSRQINNFDLVVGGNAFYDEGYRKLETEQRHRINFGTRYRFQKVKGLSIGVNGNLMDSNGGYFILWQNADSAYYPQGGTVSTYHLVRRTIDPFIIYFTPKGHRHSLKTRYYIANNENNTNQESISKVWYGEYQYQMHLKKELTITSGITGTYSEVISAAMYGNHFSDNLGIFSQADKKFNRWNISLGIRGEYFKVDTAETKSKLIIGKDTSIIPIHPVARAGVNYRLTKYTHLRASFGQGYRFPSVAEKYVSTKVSGLTLYPNPELQPETGWSAEIGAKQAFKISNWRGYLDIAGFWQEYKSMMEFTFDYWVPSSIINPSPFVTAGYFGAKSINVGRARIMGTEVTVAGEGKIGKVNITILGGYTYIKPLDLSYDSARSGGTYNKPDSVIDYVYFFNKDKRYVNANILKYRYEHTAKLDVQADYKKFSMGVSLRYNSFMKNIDRKFENPMLEELFPTWKLYILPGLKSYREEHNTGDIVFDARFSYEIAKGVRTALVVNNLFNRETMGRPGDVQPPRTVSVVVSAKI
jgi:iron complex outermembrane receptor protein